VKKPINVRQVKNKPFRITKFFWLGVAVLVMIIGIGMIIPIKPSTDTFELAVNASSLTTVDTKGQIEGLRTQMLNSWQEEARQKGVLSIPKRYQGVTLNAVKPNNKDKIIALTFDDGPWPKYTEQILDILKANNVKGTFFVIGKNMKNLPEVGKRIVTDGHIIANHTWHHWYHRLSPSVAAKEIDDTEDIIYKVTGVRTNLFRPPGGVLGNGPAAYARGKNYSVIMWSADSHDYKRPAASRLLGNVMRFSKPGGIVLMHDGGGVRDSTVKALPEMIKKFKQQGYRFVTIPEMLELEDQQLAIASK
jgi:peptidoglycan/xylan/chitin deacetylase (PgdA/CDA1 family)